LLCFCIRLRLAHRRATARENYHLAMPGSTLAAADRAVLKAAQGAERECGRGIVRLSAIETRKAGWTVNIGCPI
jgi:hypothetical protein